MLEMELVEQITNYLQKYRIRYSKEIRMGIGVPDIVLNIGASKSIIPISDYYLLSFIECICNKNRLSLDELADLFPIEKQRLLSYINQLADEKVITEKNNFIYANKKIFGLNLGKTISIEAKIKDWKSGILQAQRYLMFSDFSYLALPEEKIKNVELAQVEKNGIGLLSVKNNKIEEIVRPSRSNECDYKQKYIATSTIIKNNDNIINRRNDGVFSAL